MVRTLTVLVIGGRMTIRQSLEDPEGNQQETHWHSLCSCHSCRESAGRGALDKRTGAWR